MILAVVLARNRDAIFFRENEVFLENLAIDTASRARQRRPASHCTKIRRIACDGIIIIAICIGDRQTALDIEVFVARRLGRRVIQIELARQVGSILRDSIIPVDDARIGIRLACRRRPARQPLLQRLRIDIRIAIVRLRQRRARDVADVR